MEENKGPYFGTQRARSRTKDVACSVCYCVQSAQVTPAAASRRFGIEYRKIKKWFQSANRHGFVEKKESYYRLTFKGRQLLQFADLQTLRRFLESSQKDPYFVVPYVINDQVWKALLKQTQDSVDRLAIGCYVIGDFELASAGHEPKLLNNVGQYVDFEDKARNLCTVRLIKYFRPQDRGGSAVFGRIIAYANRTNAEHYEDAKGRAWISAWESIRHYAGRKNLTITPPVVVREAEAGFMDSIAQTARKEVGYFHYMQGRDYIKLDTSPDVPEIETNRDGWASNYSENRPLVVTNIKKMATRNFFEELERIEQDNETIMKFLVEMSKTERMNAAMLAKMLKGGDKP